MLRLGALRAGNSPTRHCSTKATLRAANSPTTRHRSTMLCNGNSGRRLLSSAAYETSFDLLVVGGGVMGVWAAIAAAKRGAKVALVDQFEPAHNCGSSHGDGRIFRLAYEQDHYVDMMEHSLPLWMELQAVAGEPLLAKTGGVTVAETNLGSNRNDALRALYQRRGIDNDTLSAAEMNARFPQFSLAPSLEALYQKDFGVLFASKVKLHLTNTGGAFPAPCPPSPHRQPASTTHAALGIVRRPSAPRGSTLRHSASRRSRPFARPPSEKTGRQASPSWCQRTGGPSARAACWWRPGRGSRASRRAGSACTSRREFRRRRSPTMHRRSRTCMARRRPTIRSVRCPFSSTRQKTTSTAVGDG